MCMHARRFIYSSPLAMNMGKSASDNDQEANDPQTANDDSSRNGESKRVGRSGSKRKRKATCDNCK